MDQYAGKPTLFLFGQVTCWRNSIPSTWLEYCNRSRIDQHERPPGRQDKEFQRYRVYAGTANGLRAGPNPAGIAGQPKEFAAQIEKPVRKEKQAKSTSLPYTVDSDATFMADRGPEAFSAKALEFPSLPQDVQANTRRTLEAKLTWKARSMGLSAERMMKAARAAIPFLYPICGDKNARVLAQGSGTKSCCSTNSKQAALSECLRFSKSLIKDMHGGRSESRRPKAKHRPRTKAA